jgi:hypothetical protein
LPQPLEALQQEQQARLDAAGLSEHMDDGRAVVGGALAETTLDEIRDSPTRAALRQLIADLEPIARLELIAVIWLGRRDDPEADFIFLTGTPRGFDRFERLSRRAELSPAARAGPGAQGRAAEGPIARDEGRAAIERQAPPPAGPIGAFPEQFWKGIDLNPTVMTWGYAPWLRLLGQRAEVVTVGVEVLSRFRR